MNLSSLFPPTILARVLDDLGAIADAARRLPELEAAVLQRVDSMQTELTMVRNEISAVRQGLVALRGDVQPIKEISEVRKGIEPLDEDMRAVRHSVDELEPLMRDVIARLDALREDLGPLGELADKIPGIGR
jgi:hypothetical protein